MHINESAGYIEYVRKPHQNGDYVGFRDGDGMYILITPEGVAALHEIAKIMLEVGESAE